MEFKKNTTIVSGIIITLFLILSCVSAGAASQTKENSFFEQGEELYKSGDYKSALGFFIKATKSEPLNWLPYNRLGWLYLNLNKCEDAVIHFKIANNLNETSKSYIGLGEAFIGLKYYEKAKNAFYKAMNHAIDDHEKEQSKIFLANCYVMQGKYKDAYDILGKKSYLGFIFNAVENGIRIVSIAKGSPASLAGIKKGDILTNFGGNDLMNITSNTFYEKIIKKLKFGSTAKVQIKRDGRYFQKDITIGITPSLAKSVNKEKDAGLRWAVIIGISKYQDSKIPSLRYAASDAKAFYDWAISPDGGRYAPSRTMLLLNKDATGLNIKKALFEWLNKNAIAEDMVTIYYAGHGSPESPDSPENLFLLPYDTQYSSIATTGFPMWDIETALKRYIKAKKVVVIADACHSGGVGDSFDIARRSNRSIKLNPINSGIQDLSQIGKGVCVISASSGNQSSQESKKWGGGHGVFTYFLLEGLRGHADYNEDNHVSLGELTSYLSELVRRETNSTQSPTVAGRYDPALTISM